MSALNELAEEIETGVDEISGFLAWTNQAPMDLAVKLSTAGYRKPRTITTDEELDTLPNGSVVLSAVYISHHGQAISFQRWEDGDWHRGARSGSTHPDNFLPVTVLYEPEAK